ncbi:hypothetical protein D9M68_548180 [compost metagenome]
MAGQTERTGAGVMPVTGVDVIEKQEKSCQAAVHVRRREVEGVVVVEERAQRLARVADAILELVVPGVDVAVVVILELAWRGQGGAGFHGAVVITRETIAFGGRMGVVQMSGDFRGTEAHMVLRQRIMDAQNHRLPIACEDGRTRGRSARHVAFVAPDPLGWIGRVEHPVRPLLGPQLVSHCNT